MLYLSAECESGVSEATEAATYRNWRVTPEPADPLAALQGANAQLLEEKSGACFKSIPPEHRHLRASNTSRRSEHVDM